MDRPAVKKEIDLLEYWRIILKRKWVIVTVVALLVAISGIISFTTTPLYEAKVSILIEEPGSGMLTIQEILNSSANNSGDFMGTYFNTQLKILQSRSLAERVVKKMNLGTRSELQAPKNSRQSLLRMVKSVLSFRWLFPKKKQLLSADSQPVSTTDSSALYAAIILDNLSVYPVPDTRLVEIGYRSPYPRLATEIVNALSEEFISYTIESRSEATQQTKEFLSEQIARLRDDLAAKQRELQKYGDEKKIMQLNEKESSVVSKFGDLNKAVTDAQIALVNAQTAYQELKNWQADLLPQLVNNSVIQNLRTSYVTLKAEYEEKSRTMRPAHPVMIELKSKLDSIKGELESEIRKAVDAAQSEYMMAADRVQRLNKMLEAQRIDVTRMNSDAILYNSLKIEVDSKQTLLNSLVVKQNETQVSERLSGLRTSNIKIVDPAIVPDIPVSPNMQRNLIVALLLGLILGLGLAFAADFLDNSVKGPEDLEKLTGLPSLGIIPHFSPNGLKKSGDYYSGYDSIYGNNPGEVEGALAKVSEVELINHLFPKLSIAEDYRTIRTSILFSHADNAAKTITITSMSPQEGKSATLTNMAISFAQLGERVLAVDADLRKPRLHKIFQVRNLAGLTGYLTGRSSLEEAVQKSAIANLWLLPSGPHPPNPAELLNSKKMKQLLTLVKTQYDIVLIDTPPVLAVIDPVIVSSMTDSTVLVIRTGKATRKPLLRTIEELKKAKAAVIGVIFNDAKSRKNGFQSPYFQYEYYQDKSLAETARKKESSRAKGSR
jgi:capsular exopolysaccharide synthesis family protein